MILMLEFVMTITMEMIVQQHENIAAPLDYDVSYYYLQISCK